MLELLPFLKDHWKPLLVVILAAIFIWQMPAELNFWHKSRLIKQEADIMAQHTQTERANVQAQKESDSLNNFIKGREYENNDQLEKNSIHARTLPAVLLPVVPPHER